MKISEILSEDVMSWEQDEGFDFENPMPVITDDNIYEVMDDVDRALLDMHPDGDKVSGPAAGKLIVAQREKYGKVEQVPLDQIISTEKYLSNDHMVNLIKGNAKSSSRLPILYKYNSKYYVGDGNHRVIVDFINNKNTVKALVLDVERFI